MVYHGNSSFTLQLIFKLNSSGSAALRAAQPPVNGEAAAWRQPAMQRVARPYGQNIKYTLFC